jgi:hypothetical protein
MRRPTRSIETDAPRSKRWDLDLHELAALFVAQETNTDLTLQQQLAIFFVAILTSKGASGVTGAGFITLVATLLVVPTIPVAGMALILGISGRGGIEHFFAPNWTVKLDAVWRGTASDHRCRGRQMVPRSAAFSRGQEGVGR